jgi:hypothetical protein
MRYLKMLGLAAVAAMGLMAFVGASTASATTLFTDSAHKIAYPKETTIHATLEPGTTAKLTSGSTTIASCTGSTVHGITLNETGETVSGPISEKGLTWEGCNQTTHTVATGSLSVKWTSGTNGEVIGKANQVTLGIFGTSCTYGTGEGTKLGTLTSGTEPKLVINATVARTAGGFLCPTTGIWEAEYTVTEPHALYITP